MLLTADIGNTDTVLGLWLDDQLKNVSRFSTSPQRTAHEWFFLLKLWLGSFSDSEGKAQVQVQADDGSLENVIYSSVVPAVDSSIEEAFSLTGFKNITRLKADMRLPITFDYPNPKSLGADRIANSVAGIQLYGNHLIIVDFGTAITFCVVIDSVYRGGVIAPGVKAGLDFLAEKTAKLPRISFTQRRAVAPTGTGKKDASALGKSTEDSILAGVRFGWEGMVASILQNLKEDILEKNLIEDINKIQIIATGGITNHFFLNDQMFDIIDTNLTLRGLREIFLYL